MSNNRGHTATGQVSPGDKVTGPPVHSTTLSNLIQLTKANTIIMKLDVEVRTITFTWLHFILCLHFLILR